LWYSVNVDGKKKSDEEAKKKQIIGLKGTVSLYCKKRRLNISLAGIMRRL
jgi:hypothetical protein